MDVPFVNTFMGGDAAKNHDENWQEALEVWPDIVALRPGPRGKITIENCPMIFSHDEWPGGHNIAWSPHIWRRIIEQWGGTVGLNYDPSHLVWLMIDIKRFIREFGPHILHFQAKDVMIDRDGLYERGIALVGHRLAGSAPARPGRRRLGRNLLRPLPRGLRRRLHHRARGSALREAPTSWSSAASCSRATSSGRTSPKESE